MIDKTSPQRFYLLAALGAIGFLAGCGSSPQTVTTTHTVTTQSAPADASLPANPPASTTTTTTIEKHE